jgi:hypothetical protein
MYFDFDLIRQLLSFFISHIFSKFTDSRSCNVHPFFQDLPNHLVGLKQTYVKLTFLTTHDLTKVRKDLLSAVRRNKERQKTSTAYADMLAESMQVIKYCYIMYYH